VIFRLKYEISAVEFARDDEYPHNGDRT